MVNIIWQFVRQQSSPNKNIFCELVECRFTFDKTEGGPGGPQNEQIGKQQDQVEPGDNTAR